jgi:hypothetical protein
MEPLKADDPRAGPLLVGTTILAGDGANVLALDSTSG